MATPYYRDELTTLYLADSRDMADELIAQIGGMVDLILTDPPYNVSSESDSANLPLKTVGGAVGKQKLNFGDWDYDWQPTDLLNPAHQLLRPGGSLIAFTSDRLLSEYANHARPTDATEGDGLQSRGSMVWNKVNAPPRMRATGYCNSVEYIAWLARAGGSVTWNGGGATRNVLSFPICGGRERILGPDGKALHPAQKPIALLKELLSLHARDGHLVVDPYAGVGSTLVAAKMLGLRSIGIEVNPIYADAAVQRLRQTAPVVQHSFLKDRKRSRVKAPVYATLFDGEVL